MKKLILSLIILGSVIATQAQSGTITYEEVVKFDIKLEGENAHLANLMPKENKTFKTLIYNDEYSLYTSDQQVENETDVQEMAGGGAMVINMQQPDEKFFYDIKNTTSIELRDFMGRDFLITTPLDTLSWKLTGGQRIIIGQTCMEAVTKVKDHDVKAWFTPTIAVSTGPGKYHGLPGLILGIDIDNGQRTITATKLSNEPIEASKLVKPKNGKKVSREQFNKIVDEKMKEQGVDGGSGTGTIMIKITK